MLSNNPTVDANLHLKKHRKKYLIGGLLLAMAILIVVILVKLPSSPLQKIIQKRPTVEIKTTYNNPFDKSTQYVNPFEKYKNPFVTNR